MSVFKLAIIATCADVVILNIFSHVLETNTMAMYLDGSPTIWMEGK